MRKNGLLAHRDLQSRCHEYEKLHSVISGVVGVLIVQYLVSTGKTK
jgi:hypothetical protein